MIEFLLVFVSVLFALFAALLVLTISVVALMYTYKLIKLILNEKWATIFTIFIAVLIYALILSLGVYFGEEPL